MVEICLKGGLKMNLNVKKVKIVGGGNTDKITVVGSIPATKSEDVTLDFEVPARTGQNYILRNFKVKFTKWQITMEA